MVYIWYENSMLYKSRFLQLRRSYTLFVIAPDDVTRQVVTIQGQLRVQNKHVHKM